mmetsp:Transcript_43326/g.97206  ORF Transcript_43326/g.97206 Transcript_43326/m.97206 type:complete len:380 (+) Transcript_43326:51-1190(+)
MSEPGSPEQLGVPSTGLGRNMARGLCVVVASCACWIMLPTQGDNMKVRLWMAFNQTQEDEEGVWAIPFPANTLPPIPIPQGLGTMTMTDQSIRGATGPVPSPALDALIAALKWHTPNWADKMLIEHWKPNRFGGAKAWAAIDAVIDKAGHRRCGTMRDSWSCNSPLIAAMLNRTRVWNSSFDLFKKLPPGTQIIGFGNSLLAELVHTVICNHDWDVVISSPDIRTNSVVAHSNTSNITLALISNDQDIDGSMKPWHAADLVRRANWRPHIFLVGSLNSKREKKDASFRAERRKHLLTASPDAAIVDLPGKHTGDCCTTPVCGNSEDCESRFIPGHTCLPGPILRYAEQLVCVMQDALFRRDLTQSCLGVGLQRPSYECV